MADPHALVAPAPPLPGHPHSHNPIPRPPRSIRLGLALHQDLLEAMSLTTRHAHGNSNGPRNGYSSNRHSKDLLPPPSTTPLHRVLGHLRGLTLLTPWLLYLLLSDILLSLLLPLKPILPTTTYDLSSLIASSVWSWIQHIFTASNNASITLDIRGTLNGQLPQSESAIVVSNHVSWTDFYMIQELAQKAGMLGRCRWFAKQSLRWVPFLGWGLWAMGMPLVSRRWTKDEAELEKVFSGIIKGRWPVWLISYSEGTRFAPSKHALALSHCRSRSLPLPTYTLWPRTRGFVATVQALRKTSHVRAVYDITIAYSSRGTFMQPPDFWQTIAPPVSGLGMRADLKKEGYKFHAQLDRFEIDDLPETDEELGKWLEQRWIAKDKNLQRVKEMLELD